MSKPMRFLVLSLAVAACAATAASAWSHASAQPVCGPRGPVTLAHDAHARVYRSHGIVWGCAHGVARVWNLGTSTGHRPVYLAAVGGVRAAYATGAMGVDTFSSSLTEQRLDTGKITATPVVSDLRLGVESHVSIAALVIKPGGALAWTVSSGSIGAPHGGVELRTYTHGHTRTLERNHGLEVKSLSLHGSRLRWHDAGGWHSAQLA